MKVNISVYTDNCLKNIILNYTNLSSIVTHGPQQFSIIIEYKISLSKFKIKNSLVVRKY